MSKINIILELTEEEMLKRAIVMSLEEEYLADEDDEENLLQKAIAMSLEAIDEIHGQLEEI